MHLHLRFKPAIEELLNNINNEFTTHFSGRNATNSINFQQLAGTNYNLENNILDTQTTIFNKQFDYSFTSNHMIWIKILANTLEKQLVQLTALEPVPSYFYKKMFICFIHAKLTNMVCEVQKCNNIEIQFWDGILLLKIDH